MKDLRLSFGGAPRTLTVDPYALLNFKVGYDKGTGWSGYIEGRSLLDARYISSTVTVGTADPNRHRYL